jgi:hypothetical protein
MIQPRVVIPSRHEPPWHLFHPVLFYYHSHCRKRSVTARFRLGAVCETVPPHAEPMLWLEIPAEYQSA